MARWAGENAYDAEVSAAAARYGVAAPLIKAVIAQESGFDPRAYRQEAKIGDASRGLMQLLLSTARALGYGGPAGNDTTRVGGLYDPAVSVDLGTRLLKQNLDRGKGVDAALSAYNGGWRPSLGFGEPLASTGQFRNQAYVDGVRDKVRYFAALVGQTETTVEADTLPGPKLLSPAVIGLVVLLLGLLAVRYLGGK